MGLWDKDTQERIHITTPSGEKKSKAMVGEIEIF